MYFCDIIVTADVPQFPSLLLGKEVKISEEQGAA
jgi:hypothetical protein